MRPLLLAVLLTVLTALLPAPTHAQGPFAPHQSWWLGPGGSLGIQPDLTLQNLLVDDDGDGLLEAGEGAYPFPAIVKNQLLFYNLRLSPSRQYIYISGTPSSGPCSGAKIFLYRIPATSGQPLQALVQGECIAQGIAFEGFFEDPAYPNYPIFFAVGIAHPTTLLQEIFWVNMATGTSGYTNNTNFNSSVVSVTFEPSGIAAFVQHDSDADAFADYTVVELCEDDFGQGIPQGGGALAQVPAPPLDGASVDDGSGGLDFQALQGATVIDQFPLDTCVAPPAPSGACCLTDGSCSELTEATCESPALGGTWQGAGTTCAGTTCPPAAIVLLTMAPTGPAVSAVNTPITYNLAYSNIGGLTATNATVNALVPNGLTFVSVAGGGSYDPVFRRVTWTLGSLAAGAGGSVEFSAEAPCGLASATLSSAWIASDQSLVLGAPVTTTFTSGPIDPLQWTTTSAADNGTPALNGDTITHTITLTNTLGVARNGLSFSFNLGSSQQPELVLDDGGGVATLAGFTFQWAGSLGPFAAATIQFQTRIDECRIAGVTETRLNNGFNFNVTGDCGDVLAIVTPDAAIPLGAVPLEVTLETPTVAMATVPPGGFWQPFGMMRSGTNLEYELTVANNYATALSNVNVGSTIPAPLLPATDPPFVGPVPAGFSYDAGTRTIRFTGDIPPSTTLSVRWEATDPGTGSCAFFGTATATFGSCANQQWSPAPTVYRVASAPGYRHPMAITPFSGLWSTDASVTSFSQLSCISFEIHGGLGEGIDGDIWVAGTPAYRYNPDALEMQIFDTAFFNANGMSAPTDVAVAPDGTVYFCGSNLSGGARILALDPTWQNTSIIYDEAVPSLGSLQRIILDGDGFLAASAWAGVLRVDPAFPVGAQVYVDPAMMTLYGPIALDQDGDYLVCELTFGAGPRRLAKIDRATGAHTVEMPDLGIVVNTSVPFFGMTVEGDVVYFAPQTSLVRYLDRSGTPSGGLVFGGPGQWADIEMIGQDTVGVDDPRDPVAMLPTRVEFPPNAPNPFNPSTVLTYALPHDGPVTLVVHDLRGRRVRTLVDTVRPAGVHTVTWQGRDDTGAPVASGVYVARLRAGPVERTQKLVLTK